MCLIKEVLEQQQSLEVSRTLLLQKYSASPLCMAIATLRLKRKGVIVKGRGRDACFVF